MRLRRFVSTFTALVSACAAGFVAAPDASAAASYRSYSLGSRSGKCFASMVELEAHRAASAEIDLVAFYNWIDYNQAGGYLIIQGPHNCTPAYDDEGYYFNFRSTQLLPLLRSAGHGWAVAQQHDQLGQHVCHAEM